MLENPCENTKYVFPLNALTVSQYVRIGSQLRKIETPVIILLGSEWWMKILINGILKYVQIT